MWEYMVLLRSGKSIRDIRQELNRLGKDGWELVAVCANGWHYLKRRA